MASFLLIVDDDPNICETATDILEEAGFSVRTASTGAEALEELRQAPVQLILMDFNLPDMNAKKLAQEIHAIHPTIKMVLLTGEHDPNLGPAKSMIHTVLTKPVLPSHLVGLIKQILDQ